jgi:hypothetical protein
VAATGSLRSWAPAATFVPGEILTGVGAVGTAAGDGVVGVVIATYGAGRGGCSSLCAIGIWVHRRSWSEMW